MGQSTGPPAIIRLATGILCVLGIALVLACGGAGEQAAKPPTGTAPVPAAPPKPTTRGDNYEAQVVAEKFVKQGLKFPLDAEFPWFGTEASYDKENQQWIVSGTVKAKNAFGGQLTQAWTAILFVDDSNTWRCRVLTIGDELIHADLKTPTPGEIATAKEEARARPPAPPRELTPEEQAERTELRAASKLSMAKALQERGNEAKAHQWLTEIVRDFPETDAGREAAKMLE